MEWLNEFFGAFFNDIYNLAVQFSAWIVVRFALQWVEFKLFMLNFTWDVAKEVLLNIEFSAMLSSSFNLLPPGLRGILLYLHFDKGLTILSQAFVTRFMLNMMGW